MKTLGLVTQRSDDTAGLLTSGSPIDESMNRADTLGSIIVNVAPAAGFDARREWGLANAPYEIDVDFRERFPEGFPKGLILPPHPDQDLDLNPNRSDFRKGFPKVSGSLWHSP